LLLPRLPLRIKNSENKESAMKQSRGPGRIFQAFMLLIIILFTAQGAYASYDDALRLFTEKKYKESLKELADILVVEDDLKPDSPNYRIRFLAAHNHWKLGNFTPATSHFKRCMVIKKDKVDPYIDLSLMLLETGKTGSAERIARKGLGIKKDAMLYFVLGKSSIMIRNYWRAKQLLEKANSIDPEIFIFYHYLGITLLKLKKYSQANTAFSAASAIRDDVPETLNNLALTYEFMGKKKEALKYYRQALELNSKNETILKNIKRLEKHK
jgi:tetratricopeptide (TPR) repeat protein